MKKNLIYYYNGFNAIEGAIINGEQVKWIGPFNQVKKNLMSTTLDKDRWDEEENDPNAINKFLQDETLTR